jgi:FkbM family methyltransferase
VKEAALAEDMIVLDGAPLLLSLVRFMMRHRIRGAWRLFELLKRREYFQRKIIRYEIKKGFSVHVPIYRPERRWDRFDLLHYERELLDKLVDVASTSNSPLTIVDCGADLGVISILLAVRLGRISRILAFEPNKESFSLLQKNLSGIPIAHEAFQSAVSDFAGRGELKNPDYDNNYDQSRYLVPVTEGGFSVTTLDALQLSPQDLLIKVDVEGGELAVIRGARNTIATAKSVIITTEAHPRVFRRTGIDPIVVLREIAAVRPFRFIVCETGESDLDLSKPFFEQMPTNGAYNYNVVACSN